MIYQKKTINNVPTKVPLSNSAPVGNPIGTIISTYKKIQPRNYLYCDGSTFDETLYPALYLYLGTNVLPDYRECAMVGAEKNTTDVFDSTETNPSTGLPGTQNHDVYSQGEFKDDQLQNHQHLSIFDRYGTTYKDGQYSSVNIQQTQQSGNITNVINARNGTVTRGKRKAVYYYIKAVAGVDISDEDTFLNTVKDYVDSIEDISSTVTVVTPFGNPYIYKHGKMVTVIMNGVTNANLAPNTLVLSGLPKPLTICYTEFIDYDGATIKGLMTIDTNGNLSSYRNNQSNLVKGIYSFTYLTRD